MSNMTLKALAEARLEAEAELPIMECKVLKTEKFMLLLTKMSLSPLVKT